MFDVSYFRSDKTIFLLIVKYFSWGDIRGQNKNGTYSYNFSQDNYNVGVCGLGHNLASYIPQGDAGVDAATANMSSYWKMPTKTQINELINGTNSTWITLNGVNGRKFTSKTDSSKYIFLPAAGWRSEEYHNGKSTEGQYWSTKHGNLDNAYHISFQSGGYTVTSSTNWLGFSVRAIQSAIKRNSQDLHRPRLFYHKLLT